MDAQLQRRIQRYGWDRAVDYYEASWAAQLKPAQDRLLTLAALQPGERVLELACGTGLVTFRVAEAVGPDGRVEATDISEKMGQFTAAEATRRGLAQVRCSRMGAESLDFPDDSFDAVLCALGLMYVPDVAAALAEMHRVLAPGGRAVAAVWGARHRCGWADIFPIVESRVQSDVCPMFFQLGTGDSLADASRVPGSPPRTASVSRPSCSTNQATPLQTRPLPAVPSPWRTRASTTRPAKAHARTTSRQSRGTATVRPIASPASSSSPSLSARTHSTRCTLRTLRTLPHLAHLAAPCAPCAPAPHPAAPCAPGAPILPAPPPSPSPPTAASGAATRPR